MPARIHKAKENFLKLNAPNSLATTAITNLKYWLLHPDFEPYQDQIDFLIDNENFEELFDSFFQVIPFGTGGRRGRVGIGPNRINPWTIAASAQGHSQFLIKKYGEKAKERGIVIAYDVRQYMDKSIYSQELHNPIWGITSKDLAEIAASVYVKNNIKVHFFHEVTSTPQLSFTIRDLNAVSGINISASHNPPDYNGKKVYDETGGQLIPPHDQKLADEVNNHVNIFDVEWGIFNRNVEGGLIKIIDRKTEEKYIQAVSQITKSKNRNARILFSPLHGTGKSNIYRSMKNLDFDIHIESESSIPSGEFETVPNKIPNPELPIVYERLQLFADEIEADLIITSDPDADRMGLSVKHNNSWQFLDGNQIAVLLADYVLSKSNSDHSLILTTIPVTKLITKICNKNGAENRDKYIPGFKYFGDAMNKFERDKQIHRVLISMEDTFGHLTGNYARDKDGCVGSILLSEFAGELKLVNKTLINRLEEIYAEYGFHKNIVHQIQFEHSYEKNLISDMMHKLRNKKQNLSEELIIKKYVDHWHEGKIISETDKSSRNLLEYEIDTSSTNFLNEKINFARITIRPSGTEPKLKIYIEVSVAPGFENLENMKSIVNVEIEKIIKLVTNRITI